MTALLRRIRFRRDHRWTPGHLSAYVDDELALRSRGRLRQHVKECSECHHALRTLERMLELMHRLPPVDGEQAPDIAAVVRRRLRDRTLR